MNQLPVMCETKELKWGYRITNPVTKTRVTVGPFKDKSSALLKMNLAHGTYKKVCEAKKFHFTPAWNNWKEEQYEGEDVVFCLKSPPISN